MFDLLKSKNGMKSLVIFYVLIISAMPFSQPNLISLKTDFLISPKFYSENTCKVIKTDFSGTDLYSIVISTGQGRPGELIKKNFNINQWGDSVYFSPGSDFNVDKSYNTLINNDSDIVATDAQIIKLKDGSFLAVKIGSTIRDLPNKPKWWYADGMNADFGNVFGQRGALFFFKSINSYSTNNWQKIGIFDAATELGGVYGFPRLTTYDTTVIFLGDNTQKNLNIQTPQNINIITKSFYLGGFDRFEIYQDPWSGRIYLSMWGVGGVNKKDFDSFTPTEKQFHQLAQVSTMILYSDDLCKTWNSLDVYDGLEVPLVMTSLPDGRFCVFYSTGGKAWIRFTSLKTPGILGPPMEVTENGETSAIDVDAHIYDWVPELSISRISMPGNFRKIGKLQIAGLDKVRVSYPALNSSGRQTFVIKTVEMKDIVPYENDPEVPFMTIPYIKVKKIKTIEAVDKNNMSTMLGTFIDPDYVDMSASSNTSVFYWMESTYRKYDNAGKLTNKSQPKRYNARYCIFYGDDKSTSPDYLSKSGGKPREWTQYPDYTWPTPDSVFIGNYMSGGFVWGSRDIIQGGKNGANLVSKDTLNYICQWLEPDGLHGNIITVNAKKKPETINNPPSAKQLYFDVYGGFSGQKQDFTSESQRYTTKSESRTSATYGFNFGYRFSDWVAFETGFGVFNSAQNLSVTDGAGKTFLNDNANPLNIISVPLKYTPRINVTGDIHLLPSIGLKFLFGSSEKSVSTTLTSQNNSGNLILSAENTFGSSPMISLEAGLGIEWNILSKLSFILKGNLSSLLSDNIKSAYKDASNINLGNILNKLESLSGLLGVRYYLPKF